jgi:Ca2+/Na+ antiporter
MVGQELIKHLQHLEEQLAKLLNSYQDYKSRDIQKGQMYAMSISSHILIVAVIIFIIITATYAISSFIVEAKEYIAYIAAIQALLTMGLYLFFTKKMTKESQRKQKPHSIANSNKSLYELDKLRFDILQELATSPIPQNYITPTAIKMMQQLIKSGMYQTIDECIAHLNHEMNNQKHEEEKKLIHYLQVISYH